MIYYNGNLFDSKADILCHQVNLYGIMGAELQQKSEKGFLMLILYMNVYVHNINQ